MKKSFVFTLVLSMLLSLGWSGLHAQNVSAASEDVAVSFSEVINFAEETGITRDGDSGHGNHQTRVVHTSHGDYVAYVTDTIGEMETKRMDQFTIFKVGTDGTTEVVFQEYKNYDTSQVSLLVDNDENVWAVTIADNKLRDQFDGRVGSIITAAYCIDAETDEVSGYTANHMIEEGNFDVFTPGYNTPIYDSVNNKIYCLSASGDAPVANIIIMVFDVESRTWEKRVADIDIPSRDCYIYAYTDGKGGLVLTANRDIKCTTVGYPEIGSDYGLSDQDKQELIEAQGQRWSANYCWDAINMYYIPDLNDENTTSLPYYSAALVAPDYSKVHGDQEYRYSKEGRMNNLYPGVTQNSYGGETYIDNDGYLHAAYNIKYFYAGWNRSVQPEDYWYHTVWDISDPANMKEVSKTLLVDQVAEGVENCYRFYDYGDNGLYLIAGESEDASADSELVVYECVGTPEEGYTYEEVASQAYTGNYLINISNNRGNSLEDGKFAAVFSATEGNNTDTYLYMQASFYNKEDAQGEFKLEGANMVMVDKDGNTVAPHQSQFTVVLKDAAGNEYFADVKPDGTFVFRDAAPINGVGEFKYTLTMKQGPEKEVDYSDEVFEITVTAQMVDGQLVTEITSITKDGAPVQNITFSVKKDAAAGSTAAGSTAAGSDVKTENGPDTGDNANIGLWIGIAVVALIAVVVLFIMRKKIVKK